MAEYKEPFSIAVSLNGNEGAIRLGLAETLSSLSPLGLSEDELGTIELVLAEALNNIIEHALVDAPTDTQIEIQAHHSVSGLQLVVVDQGLPMPKGKAPESKEPDLDVALMDMPEGGFGWFMIYTLTETVEYTRVGNANHLSLRLSVGI